MASSRWKRLAFFDRTNVSLPPDVVEDVIPRASSLSGKDVVVGGGGGGGRTTTSGMTGVAATAAAAAAAAASAAAAAATAHPLPDLPFLFPEEFGVEEGVDGVDGNDGDDSDNDDDDARGAGMNDDAAAVAAAAKKGTLWEMDDAHRGEYFSFAVTRAPPPPPSSSSSSPAAATTATLAADDPTITTTGGVDGIGGAAPAGWGGVGVADGFTGAAGMRAALAALAGGAGVVGGVGGSANSRGSGASSAANVAISPAGRILLAGADGVSATGGKRGGGENAEHASSLPLSSLSFSALGGMDLILALVSSRRTNLIHCVDLTVRCHPPGSNSTGSSSSSSSSLAHFPGRGATAVAGVGGTGMIGNVSSTSPNSAAVASAASAPDKGGKPGGGGGGSSSGGGNGAGSTDAMASSLSSPSSTAAVADANRRKVELEDLDGWRGHYEPFARGIVVSSSASSLSLNDGSSAGAKGIVGSSGLSTRTTRVGMMGGLLLQGREQRVVAEHMTPGSVAASSALALETNEKGGTNMGPRGGARVVGVAARVVVVSAAAATTTTAAAAAAASNSSVAGEAGAGAIRLGDVLQQQQQQPPSAALLMLLSQSGRSNAASSFALHVASITDSPNSVGVSVQVNPHLHLNPSPPSSITRSSAWSLMSTPDSGGTTTATTTTSSAAGPRGVGSNGPNMALPPADLCHQPPGLFDLARYGRPRCVDVGPNGVVAVGTDRGVVLVYTYDRDAATASSSSSSSSAVDARKLMTGFGGTRRLNLIMEIPAPPTSSAGGGAGAGAGSGGTGGASTAAAAATHAVSGLKLVVVSAALAGSGDGGGGTAAKTTAATASSSSSKRGTGAGAAGERRERTRLFVAYRRRRRARLVRPAATSSAAAGSGVGGAGTTPSSPGGGAAAAAAAAAASPSGPGGGGGVCCYDLGAVGSASSSSTEKAPTAPSARYDLDGRDVSSSCLCDAVVPRGGWGTDVAGAVDADDAYSSLLSREGSVADHYMVARSDGLYTYSHQDKAHVSPIDGAKLAVCAVPPPPIGRRRRFVPTDKSKTTETAGEDGGAGAEHQPRQEASAPSSSARPMSGSNAPPPPPSSGSADGAGATYALVASTDAKSGRDAVDVYDTSHKLVAFHVLLSPGHRALRAAGVAAFPVVSPDGTVRGGRSSAIVLTSGGSIVALTERVTSEKVALLVQKNLFAAAISTAYADPSYRPEDVTALYRRHAEHLYRKGDYAAAMDQYIFTVGSLEPSHIIFRYLDAPKIPLLARYLEILRSRDLATSVHAELLKTCYLKLNDSDAAERISASLAASSAADGDAASTMAAVSAALGVEKGGGGGSSLVGGGVGGGGGPSEALALICTLEAPRAAEALMVHGPTLARALPRETAGVVVALCDGTYGPGALADAAAGLWPSSLGGDGMEGGGGGGGSGGKTRGGRTPARGGGGGKGKAEERPIVCDRYPVRLFASSFLENPKLLRLMLAHCRRNHCPLTPSLRRALLELTLEEWNHARRTGDGELEKARRSEAMSILTDPHYGGRSGGDGGGGGAADGGIGDYEALVIVQTAGFSEGEVLLYERLQMAPMLLERYAKDGGERARRQMLAMCRTDPELLADVLGYFVSMAGDRMTPPAAQQPQQGQRMAGGGAAAAADDEDEEDDDFSDVSDADGYGEVLEDIREALCMARAQGVLPPVRIARILAGEGTGEFSGDSRRSDGAAGSGGGGGSGGSPQSVPLSVALEYIGAILDESSVQISRLKGDVEEYNRLCNSMEDEINSLLKASRGRRAREEAEEAGASSRSLPRVNIEDMLSKAREAEEQESASPALSKTEELREEFWREMGHSEDRFSTVASFLARGIIE